MSTTRHRVWDVVGIVVPLLVLITSLVVVAGPAVGIAVGPAQLAAAALTGSVVALVVKTGQEK